MCVCVCVGLAFLQKLGRAPFFAFTCVVRAAWFPDGCPRRILWEALSMGLIRQQLYSSFFRQIVTLVRQHGSPSAPAADLRPLSGSLRVEHGIPPGRGTDPQADGPGRCSSSVVSSSLASSRGRASKRGHSLVLGPGHRHDPRRDRQHYHLGVPGLHHLCFGRSRRQQPQECSVEMQIATRQARRSSVQKRVRHGAAYAGVCML